MENNITFSKDKEAKKCLILVQNLQKKFVYSLNKISHNFGKNKEFEAMFWLRDNGINGGGKRFESRDKTIFNTASINISQVHYDQLLNKKLQSVTAFSTIIHPKNPNIPSIHIHISLTKLKNNKSYWRIMADLNPSIENKKDKDIFISSIKELSNKNFKEGISQGDKYFYIPELKRHRGICHFYLENYQSSDKEKDFIFVNDFGEGVINSYINIVENTIKDKKITNSNEMKKQLDYHTLYLFQVLTLDRGTTAGLLIHNQNDIGIMGSLPNKINKKLLLSWIKTMKHPKDILLLNIINCINDNGIIDVDTKKRLANCVRNFYQKYPEILSLQAKGNTIPSTISNHKIVN